MMTVSPTHVISQPADRPEPCGAGDPPTQSGPWPPGPWSGGLVSAGDAPGGSPVGETAVAAAGPEWERFSQAVTREVPEIADRDDLTVLVAPGAGQGSPACLLVASARIEVDGVHLGAVAPEDTEPHREPDRARYPVLWGLLVHECAHGRHSAWEPSPGTPAAVVEAATLLEEARIEARQLDRRPQDRRWLRASAHQLILADAVTAATTAAVPDTIPGEAAAGEAAAGEAGTGDAASTQVEQPRSALATVSLAGQRWAAGRVAALVLARAEIGVFTDEEVAPVWAHVESVLGAADLDRLRELWQEADRAGESADRDGSLIELGSRWCEVIGVGDDALRGPSPAWVEAALEEVLREVLAAVLAQAIVEIDRAADISTADGTADGGVGGVLPAGPGVRSGTSGGLGVVGGSGPLGDLAETVFEPGASLPAPLAAGTRPPSSRERSAARVLARGLDAAGARAKTVTSVSSAIPPGRLRMRGALAADAQREAGAAPTARPFTRKVRRAVPNPPLRIGIGCDVSGSMCSVTSAVASAAWIFADAARHTTTDMQTATVVFGSHVHAVTRPGQIPREVTEFDATDIWEVPDLAIDVLDGALGLSEPGGGARLLVLISDGYWRDEPRAGAQQRVDALRALGCGLVWLSPPDDLGLGPAQPLRGATVLDLTDPTTTARAIATAAARALRVT